MILHTQALKIIVWIIYLAILNLEVQINRISYTFFYLINSTLMKIEENTHMELKREDEGLGLVYIVDTVFL